MKQARAERFDLLLVAALALAARVVFCLTVYPALAQWFESRDGYDVIANNLLHGAGYVIGGTPAAGERLPLYPLLLLLSFSVFGNASWPWQLAQSICGALTCGLLFRMARAHSSRAGALAAGCVGALHPTLILYTARPLTETVFVLLLLWWVRQLTFPGRRPSGAGVLWGLQLLTKTTAMFHAAALLPQLARGRFSPVAKVAGAALLVITPWLVWNLWTVGRPNLAAAPVGRTLYHGWYISRHVGWATPAGSLNRYAEFQLWKQLARAGVPPSASPGERDQRAGQLARTWIANHRWQAFRLWSRNLLLTWYLGRSRASMLVHFLLHGLLLIAAPIGAVRIRRAHPDARELILVSAILIVVYTVLHAAVQPAVRYILPVVPLALLLAAGAIGDPRK